MTSLRSTQIALLLCVTARALAGCGGNVTQVSGAGTTGSGGATTTTQASGGASTTTGTFTVTTTTSASTSSSTGGPCPNPTPADGMPCSTAGLSCNAGLCCGYSVVCDGQTWHLTGQPTCGMICGDCKGTPGCTDGFVCVVYTPDTGAPGQCGLDLCAGQPLSCACAAGLCLHDACASASGSQVTCQGPLGGN